MNEGSMNGHGVDDVAEVLRAQLAQGDLALATARPILRHLLANDDHALFSDEIISRIRGMARDVARQLLEAQAGAAGCRDYPVYIAGRHDDLMQHLLDDAGFLAHAHALAVEAQLLERLRSRSHIDPVLSPLVQELAAGRNPAQSGVAMAVLAAQARFGQYSARMELPLKDLPGELFHRALAALRDNPCDDAGAGEAAAAQLRESYTEAAGRTALIARLVSEMAVRASRALAIDHAGLSIFATALAMATGQERDLAMLTLCGRQFARLALSLRAAGLQPDAVEAQFVYLHPDVALPKGFELLPMDAAAAMLSAPQPEVVP